MNDKDIKMKIKYRYKDYKVKNMSRVSKGIFVLDEKESEILFEYIDLCFLDVKTYISSSKSNSLLECFCCCRPVESVLPFTPKDMFFRDKLTQWVYDLSISYIRQSGIDCNKLRLYMIECIRSSEDIVIENNKDATVVFHFNEKRSGYVTTHKDKLNYSTDDRKYIVVVFERVYK